MITIKTEEFETTLRINYIELISSPVQNDEGDRYIVEILYNNKWITLEFFANDTADKAYMQIKAALYGQPLYTPLKEEEEKPIDWEYIEKNYKVGGAHDRVGFSPFKTGKYETS